MPVAANEIEEQALGVSRETGCGKPPARLLPRRRSYSESAEWRAVGLSETDGSMPASRKVASTITSSQRAALVCRGCLLRPMAEGNAELARNARVPVEESTTALRRYISWYLSQGHRDDIDPRLPRHRICRRWPLALGRRSTVAFRRRIGRSDNDPGWADRRKWIYSSGRRAKGTLRRSGNQACIAKCWVRSFCPGPSRKLRQRSRTRFLVNVKRDVLASLNERSSDALKTAKENSRQTRFGASAVEYGNDRG